MPREFELGKNRKDVIIRPPAARMQPGAMPPLPDGLPPWEDLFKDEARDHRVTKKELKELGDFTSSILSITLSLTKMLIDARHPSATEDSVTIPLELHEANVGAGIKTGKDIDGNPIVVVKERGRERIAPIE